MFYIGIDIGKSNHEASIISEKGDLLCDSLSFTNSFAGCQKLLKMLEKYNANISKTLIGLEATGHYWLSVYSYLCELGYNLKVINPIQSDNFRNMYIRQTKNDSKDSFLIAQIIRFDGTNTTTLSDENILALKQLSRYRIYLVDSCSDLKVSLMPSDLALDLKNLSREYYDRMDNRSAYVNKLQGELRMVFPQFLKIFSKITTNTALTLLENYTSPEAFLNASKSKIINSMRAIARFGLTYAEKKCNAIIQVANDAHTFGYSVSSNFKLIRLYIKNLMKRCPQFFLICTNLLIPMNPLLLLNRFIWLNHLKVPGFYLP